MSDPQSARLFRMVLPDHTCPYGVRAKALLQENGFEVEDHVLNSRNEVDAFQAEHNVDTTPLVFIGDQRVGGCEDLERYLSRHGG